MHSDQTRKDGSSESMIHLLPTSGGRGEAGVGVTPGPSHWKSRSMWSCYSLSGLMDSTSATVVILSLAKVHECMQKFIC